MVFYIIALFLWGSFAPNVLKPNINYRIGSWGHMHSRIANIKNYHNVDILFLGSSHAYRGFDTRIFSDSGYRTFNLGSSAQTPIQTKVLLDRYLNALNPKMVIYEVYPYTLSIDGVESSLDIISNDKNDIHSLKMALKINNIKTYNTFLYGLMCDFIGLNKTYTEPISKGTDRYIAGGFVERKMRHYIPTQLKKKEITLNQIQIKNLAEIVNMLKERNIELMLTYAPLPKANYYRYTNNNYFDSLMGTYATYINFNKIMNLDDSLYFFDADHLNQNGVKKFNAKLIELLKNVPNKNK